MTGPSAAPPLEKSTFCAICEAACGLIATVVDDEVVNLRPDPDHPSSKGFACSKGVEFHTVLKDPDRVTVPMRRLPDGRFEPATWEEAFDDIGKRLRAVRRAHGTSAIGLAFGNPIAFNFAGGIASNGFVTALKTHHQYASSSVDINNYHAAGDMLYGSTMAYPIPDLASTDFALLLGTNPVVSKGSMMTTGRVRDVLVDVVDRGGRVVVVDPRRTETASLFEHVPIRPGADTWLLGAMLHVLFAEDLVDHAAISAQTSGIDVLRNIASRFDLERAARESGVAAEQIEALARAAAAASAFAIHGRCGVSLGQFSTLTKYVMRDIAVVTEAFLVLDSRLDEVGLLNDHHRSQAAHDLQEQRLIASQCARVATWHATNASPDLAAPESSAEQVALGPVQTITKPTELAMAQRRLATFLKPMHRNDSFYDGRPEIDANTARMVIASQAFLTRLFERLAAQIPGTDSIRAEFASRREILEHVQASMSYLIDAEHRGRSHRAAWQQGELTTAVRRMLRDRTEMRVSPTQLLDLASATHEATHNAGRALRRELLRDTSNLRLADPTKAIGPTRVYRKHPLERCLTDLVNVQAPSEPVARYVSPLERAALRATLEMTPTSRRPPSPYPRARVEQPLCHPR